MNFYNVINDIDIPCIYGTYRENQPIPYISYTGYGQDIFWADNGAYRRTNLYQAVYYYTTKDESKEDDIEETLLDAGYTYDKSEDFYDSTEQVYYIIYSNIKSLKANR